MFNFFHKCGVAKRFSKDISVHTAPHDFSSAERSSDVFDQDNDDFCHAEALSESSSESVHSPHSL